MPIGHLAWTARFYGEPQRTPTTSADPCRWQHQASYQSLSLIDAMKRPNVPASGSRGEHSHEHSGSRRPGPMSCGSVIAKVTDALKELAGKSMPGGSGILAHRPRSSSRQTLRSRPTIRCCRVANRLGIPPFWHAATPCRQSQRPGAEVAAAEIS